MAGRLGPVDRSAGGSLSADKRTGRVAIAMTTQATTIEGSCTAAGFFADACLASGSPSTRAPRFGVSIRSSPATFNISGAYAPPTQQTGRLGVLYCDFSRRHQPKSYDYDVSDVAPPPLDHSQHLLHDLLGRPQGNDEGTGRDNRSDILTANDARLVPTRFSTSRVSYRV